MINKTGGNRDPRSYWDNSYAAYSSSAAPVMKDYSSNKSPLEAAFWSSLAQLEGLELLEVGCGAGADTPHYVSSGAIVTSIDISEIGISMARAALDASGRSADLHVMDALDILKLDKKFDVIVGRYILHHLEPFEKFASILAQSLKPDGFIIFVENNSNNPLLLFARKHFAGRYGIPKHGDEFEHPLTIEEVGHLRSNFGVVEITFPELVFFKKINPYIFKGKPVFRLAARRFNELDDFLWRRFPAIRSWSYFQLIVARNPLIGPSK